MLNLFLSHPLNPFFKPYSTRKELMLKIKEAGDHLETFDAGRKRDSGC